MIAEGRSSTQRWPGPSCSGHRLLRRHRLSTWGKTGMAWPVTMIAAAIVTSVFASRVTRGQPGTTVGRVMSAHLERNGNRSLCGAHGPRFSGRADLHLIVAIVGAMLATANGVSSIVLRWRMQFACAVVWLPSRWEPALQPICRPPCFLSQPSFLPDRLRDIWNSARVSQAEPECQPCLSCQI